MRTEKFQSVVIKQPAAFFHEASDVDKMAREINIYERYLPIFREGDPPRGAGILRVFGKFMNCALILERANCSLAALPRHNIDIKPLLIDVFEALTTIHKCHIVHEHICSFSILQMETGHFKLCGFGRTDAVYPELDNVDDAAQSRMEADAQ